MEDKIGPNNPNNNFNLEKLTGKLQKYFSNEEINSLLLNSETVLKTINLPVDNPTVENLDSSEILNNKEVEDLIKNHLLGAYYHVFQHYEFTIGRKEVESDFQANITSAYVSRNATRYESIKEYILSIVKPDINKSVLIDKYVKSHGNFIKSNGENAKLGKVYIAKAKGKGDRGVVYLEGSFSTEASSNRYFGRTNYDNQIVWLFNTMDAANSFFDLFDDSKYSNNSTAVEKNTDLIEKSFRSSNIDPKICDELESRLLYGQEVIKIN